VARTLEVYWDFSSPFSYLASTQAEGLAARTGATLIWRPFLLGGLFKALGQPDAPVLGFSPAKRAYVLRDLQRWADFWQVPLKWPARFPQLTVKALRVWLALAPDARDGFRERAFRCIWAEDGDLTDDATLRALIGAGADDVMARTQTPEVKQALHDATSQALAAGVFGAPTFVVDGKELFWGQDRLGLVERALGGTARV